MKRRIFAATVALLAALALMLAGCAQPSANPATASLPAAEGETASPAGNGTASPQAGEATEPPAAPKDPASSPAFRYYVKVDIGMTKAEVDAALGLTAELRTGEYEPENSYQYVDGDGYGVYVMFNGELKAFTKTAIIKDEAVDVAPFTAKPVTEAQKDKIEQGMAYADIAALLGGDGVEFSRTADEKDTALPVGRILHWANADGTFIQVALTGEEKAGNVMFVD